MKRILKIAAFVLVTVLGTSLRNTVSAQDYNDQSRDVSYQTFYDELSPYGQWVDYPNYGYVWVPDAGNDFRPYSTNGHWVWTDDYEWMWVSDYDWGWAPFHYGRWEQDNYYGWFWVPGYEWSPAWVAWRDGGDYYGWAPIRPGINISVNFNIGGYNPPSDYWCFAPRRYITSPRIYDYCVDRRQNLTIINYTTIIVNNYHYGNSFGFRSGPRRYDAEVYCGRINPVRFQQTYRPGRTEFRGNTVSIYRPSVRQDNNRNLAPQHFERYDRNNNTGFRRNDNSTVRNNPNTDRRNDNTRLDRRDNNTVRQPQNNPGNTNANNGNRRFERPDNNNGQPNRDPNNRMTRPAERPDRNPNTGNTNGNNGNRPFERRSDNNGNTNTPTRQPETRRMDNNNFPQRQPSQMERRQEQPVRQPQQQPRQMERRQEQPARQPQQQVERRQEQQPRPQSQQPQQQPRQTERRDNGSGEKNSGSSGNNGSRRRF